MSTKATSGDQQEASFANVTPILDTSLPPELCKRFHNLFDEAYELFNRAQLNAEEMEDGMEDEQFRDILESLGAELYSNIRNEVSAHPILKGWG